MKFVCLAFIAVLSSALPDQEKVRNAVYKSLSGLPDKVAKTYNMFKPQL